MKEEREGEEEEGVEEVSEEVVMVGVVICLGGSWMSSIRRDSLSSACESKPRRWTGQPIRAGRGGGR